MGWHGAAGVGESISVLKDVQEGKDHFASGRSPVWGMKFFKTIPTSDFF